MAPTPPDPTFNSLKTLKIKAFLPKDQGDLNVEANPGALMGSGDRTVNKTYKTPCLPTVSYLRCFLMLKVGKEAGGLPEAQTGLNNVETHLFRGKKK